MKPTMPGITGTFIDEITADIPSANWSHDDWRRELDIMKLFGIDTVIIIRGGLGRRVTFPSRALDLTHEDDLARVFFEGVQERGMKLFFGTYVSTLSADCWRDGAWKREFDINRAFIDEVLERYSSYSCFVGWYLSHEVGMYDEVYVALLQHLAAHVKSITPDKATLISPYFMGKVLAPEGWLNPEDQAKEWDRVFSSTPGIDICAFQDATVPLGEQGDYFAAMREVCDKHGVELWANIETFARDMMPRFSPVDFRVLRDRMLGSAPYVSKSITFEFSHFLSPQSMYPSARNLFRRYCEYFGKDVSVFEDILLSKE